jgi:hypothetical protein
LRNYFQTLKKALFAREPELESLSKKLAMILASNSTNSTQSNSTEPSVLKVTTEMPANNTSLVTGNETLAQNTTMLNVLKIATGNSSENFNDTQISTTLSILANSSSTTTPVPLNINSTGLKNQVIIGFLQLPIILIHRCIGNNEIRYHEFYVPSIEERNE